MVIIKIYTIVNFKRGNNQFCFTLKSLFTIKHSILDLGLCLTYQTDLEIFMINKKKLIRKLIEKHAFFQHYSCINYIIVISFD